MKTPAQLAAELKEIVAKACNCEAVWRNEPVTAHEYVVIHETISSILHKLRAEAIDYDHRPLSEEEEDALRTGM